ncbi:MAG: aminopeptidase [Eubacteriales bacterium]|nr:aminopeptidase [Eubacteriales bacterium]
MELGYKRKNVWFETDMAEKKAVFEYGERYRKFISKAKTERLAVTEILSRAKEAGFKPLEEALRGEIKPGDKLYLNHKNKSAVLFVMGRNLEDGMNIVGAHLDAPRLDVKPLPLYEDGNMALMKTHYYGGVKTYQWVCTPLALHGVYTNADGETVHINVGENPDDPVLYITDLLIHLSKDQMQKKLAEGITGEQLNAVIGQCSFGADKESKHPVKDNLLGILNRKYGMTERDFLTAEFELVPAGPARDVGLDRAMIAGHGHDDRVCSYAGLEAILNLSNPERTAVGLFVDKEEVGSMGNTGMEGAFFDHALAEILAKTPGDVFLRLGRCYQGTRVLSADVTNGHDPSFPEVDDPLNGSKIGHGVSLSKYTGSRGKSGCNDANAEFIGGLGRLFDAHGVVWQTSELGKVDQGGGGTIAYILANKGAEVVDCGTPMLSMHAPTELVAKADAYMTYKAYRCFLEN